MSVAMKRLRTRGERLAHAMEARGIGVNELNRLAKKADGDPLSAGYVSRILNDKRESPGIDEVDAIARALRVRFEWLAFGHGMMDLGSGEMPAVHTAQKLDKPNLEAVLRVHNRSGRWSDAAVGAARAVKIDLEPDQWLPVLDRIEREVTPVVASIERNDA